MNLKRDLIQALFEAPTAAQPLWAPRGRILAYTVGIPDVAANATTTEIWLLDAESLQSERLCEGITGSNPPVSWSPDGARLAFVESGDETDRIVIVGLDGSRIEIDLTLAGHGRLALHAFFRTFAWSPCGNRILYTAYNQSPEVLADPAVNPRNDGDGLGEVERIRLWVYSLDGDQPPQALTSDGFHSGAGVWMPDGQSIAFVSNRSGREEGAVSNLTQPFGIWYVDEDGSSERPLVGGSKAVIAPAPSNDGQRIGFLAAPTMGPHSVNMELTTVDLDGGDRKSLTAGLDRSVDTEARPAAAPDGSWVVALMDGMCNVLVRAREDQSPETFSHPLPHASTPHVDAQSGEIACVTQAATVPPEVELLTPDGRSRWRTAHHTVESSARARIWSFVRDDGVSVESLALAPADASLAGVILWPHGGPHSRTSHEYRPESEAAIRHGFAVVAPNFRGSHGYGMDFLVADRLDLGGADFEDCMQALDSWVVVTGSENLPTYVTGTSYGGYLTAWAVGHTQRFIAAVAVNAVTNIESFFGQTDIPSWVYWEFGGSPLEQRELIRDRSPVQHLAGATTPTLVIHSEEDRRVPIAQGLELHALLRAAGVATDFVRYPREYHRIAEPAHRVDLISRTLDWFFRQADHRT
ncbi:MAG: S9 family peptidase [Chloroflexi bacterium]|nr:S9 family peptidase [Chloroflexota bacterium]